MDSTKINTNGFNVNIGAATGSSGWTLNATGTGTSKLTGSIKNDFINGNIAGALTINGKGGADTISLGIHKAADTVYLVANAIETITGFGSLTSSMADGLNVTASGNALVGLTLRDETFLVTNNSPLAAGSSGLVFNYNNSGSTLTAAKAADLFADIQTAGKYAISKGTGIEVLIETSITSTVNVIWEIKDSSGVFTAIELAGVAVLAGHNVAYTNFH